MSRRKVKPAEATVPHAEPTAKPTPADITYEDAVNHLGALERGCKALRVIADAAEGGAGLDQDAFNFVLSSMRDRIEHLESTIDELRTA